MSDVVYAIVFSGEVVEGFQTFSVKAHLSQMLKADANKMATLFSGKPIVLKRTADKQEAIKYGTALKKVGADVKIKAMKAEAAPAPKRPATPSTDAPAAPAVHIPDDWALLPNDGNNLVEPAAPPPEPALDLSAYQVAENDGSPLVSPSTFERASIDTSDLSVSENDGSPLVAPSDVEVPRVEVPDFGLDEPGAVLETLREEKVMVNPDISGLSLAEAGSDLLTDDERDRGPAPRAPDVSSLQLADA